MVSTNTAVSYVSRETDKTHKNKTNKNRITKLTHERCYLFRQNIRDQLQSGIFQGTEIHSLPSMTEYIRCESII